MTSNLKQTLNPYQCQFIVYELFSLVFLPFSGFCDDLNDFFLHNVKPFDRASAAATDNFSYISTVFLTEANRCSFLGPFSVAKSYNRRKSLNSWQNLTKGFDVNSL